MAPPAGAGAPPQGHIASLKLLNKQRWEAQLQQQQATGNHLFNRPNPFYQGDDPAANDSRFVQPYVRTRHPDRDGKRLAPKRGRVHYVDARGEWVDEETYDALQRREKPDHLDYNQKNQLRYVPVYGQDPLALAPDSRRKYRIPHTSVVNKVGDCKLFFCCGWRLTAAQWIWWMNAFCFVVHLSMVFVTFHMAYRRHGLWPSETDHMDVRIHRISMIPTPEMIRQNLTMWGSGWNGSLAVTEFYIKDNGLSVNYATLVMVFFGISAVFHFWALIMGAFEACWFWYWRQLDDGFAYWRWLEYSGSASVMAMTIAISIGIREQNTLAGIFMLHFCTMMFGLLVEYISLPKSTPDDNAYKNPVGDEQFRVWRERLRDRNENPDKAENMRFYTDYRRDPRALKLISQSEWEARRRASNATPGRPDAR